jgi:hypothetical protein
MGSASVSQRRPTTAPPFSPVITATVMFSFGEKYGIFISPTFPE